MNASWSNHFSSHKRKKERAAKKECGDDDDDEDEDKMQEEEDNNSSEVETVVSNKRMKSRKSSIKINQLSTRNNDKSKRKLNPLLQNML